MVSLTAIAAITLAATPAAPTTSSSTISVGITVTSSCGLSVSNIDFESMDPAAPASTGGPLRYRCSPGSLSPSISYGQGLHYSGGNQLAGAATGATIPYSLTMPAIASLSASPPNARISATLSARGTLPTADVFSDTVILTLSY